MARKRLRICVLKAPFEDAIAPDLLVLDLNMPRKDGWELLGELKTDAKLRDMPVIILSSFTSDHEIADAYGLNVFCCLKKPFNLSKFTQTINAIEKVRSADASDISVPAQIAQALSRGQK